MTTVPRNTKKCIGHQTKTTEDNTQVVPRVGDRYLFDEERTFVDKVEASETPLPTKHCLQVGVQTEHHREDPHNHRDDR